MPQYVVVFEVGTLAEKYLKVKKFKCFDRIPTPKNVANVKSNVVNVGNYTAGSSYEH